MCHDNRSCLTLTRCWTWLNLCATDARSNLLHACIIACTTKPNATQLACLQHTIARPPCTLQWNAQKRACQTLTPSQIQSGEGLIDAQSCVLHAGVVRCNNGLNATEQSWVHHTGLCSAVTARMEQSVLRANVQSDLIGWLPNRRAIVRSTRWRHWLQ